MLTVRHLLEQKARAVLAVAPDDPVLEAIRAMAQHHVGALLVMQNNELLGIVSERDYARKVILLGRSSADTAVRDIMTSPVVTVSPLSTLDECMRLVADRRVRYLPVVANGRAVGVVSIGDLVKATIEEQQRTIEQLESYIHHS
jgi:CBS domain-containing protein